MASDADKTSRTKEANNDVALTSITTSTDPSKTETENENDETSNEKDATDKLIPSIIDTVTGEISIPEEFNIYRNKKTLTQGLMDIALFSANANQLRYVIERGASTGTAFIYIVASLIIISLILQVGVGVLLLISTKYTVCEKYQREMAYKCGNYVTVGIFLITVVNVFIAAFGGSAMAGVVV